MTIQATTSGNSGAAMPMQAAIDIIEDEHRTLAAVLHGFRYMVREIRAGRTQPDFELLRAMVYYVDAFPERAHHPKEEQFLFARLRARTGEADSLLDQLGREHEAGDSAIRALEKRLLAYEFGNEFDEFARAAESYVEAYLSHMRNEENGILPLARKHLVATDWAEIGAAFAENVAPAAAPGRTNFRTLFTRIVNLAPPPIGVGPLFPRT